MMNAETVANLTKHPEITLLKPAFPSPEPIDLDRVVFDPEYRARVRDALNRAAWTPQSRPTQASRRESCGGA